VEGGGGKKGESGENGEGGEKVAHGAGEWFRYVVGCRFEQLEVVVVPYLYTRGPMVRYYW
jgi:hypothetical protein